MAVPVDGYNAETACRACQRQQTEAVQRQLRRSLTPEDDYGDYVWTEREVRDFLENNLGLSKGNKIRGRVVAGHNESLFFWRELIEKGELTTPFDVIHVDSHADLGLGYRSWAHILDYLLKLPTPKAGIAP